MYKYLVFILFFKLLLFLSCNNELENENNNITHLYNRAINFYNLQNYIEASNDFKSVLELKPRFNYDCYELLSYSLLNTGDTLGALDILNSAAGYFPDKKDNIYSLRYYLFAYYGMKQESLTDIRNIEIAKNDSLIYYGYLSSMHIVLKEYDSALYVNNQFVALSQKLENKNYLYVSLTCRAMNYLKIGDTSMACQDYLKSLQYINEPDTNFHFCK